MRTTDSKNTHFQIGHMDNAGSGSAAIAAIVAVRLQVSSKAVQKVHHLR
jgi:hypothetical protein